VSISWPRNPHIYELNTRIWLRDLSLKYGKAIELSNVPNEELEALKKLGFDALWLMGAWLPSPKGEEIARSHRDLRTEFERALPDLKEEDIASSPYAVYDYFINPAIGGEYGMRMLRQAMHACDLRLILDFVPNHTAIDHPWLTIHPEYYVTTDEQELLNNPDTYFEVTASDGVRSIIAHGKDPYYPAWTDTAQLNYFNPSLISQMIEVLLQIASKSDGVRCDMAMLILKDIHYRIWGKRLFNGLSEGKAPPEEFWARAIREVKEKHPDFLFIAETYWMREGELQSLGFDYTYDKPLYDWLKSGESYKIAEYIKGPLFYQERCLRFIENHDEERAHSAFGAEPGKSAALLISTLPGCHLYHEGQLEGYFSRCPVQLSRRRVETIDTAIREYYESLLSIVTGETFRKGTWTPLDTYPAWEENFTYRHFIIYLWDYRESLYLVVVNYSPERSQCYVPLPFKEFLNSTCILEDLLEENHYERDGDILSTKGLYLDMRAFYRHLFEIKLLKK